MIKYDVTLYETYAVAFEVEAESQEEAYEKAYELYWEGLVEAAVPVDGAKFIEGDFISANLIEEIPSGYSNIH